MGKDFASQKKAFASVMAAGLAAARPGIDKNGFHVLMAEDLCSIEIDPDLDQETRIKLAMETFEESLKDMPNDKNLAHLELP